jgi:3-dehydroquinate dehydratase-2
MAAKLKILVVNGPNLNMLGKREPEKYGTQTLSEIMSELTNTANSLNVELTHFQSNGEQALIERIHNAWQAVVCIIINPAAFTHTSVALLMHC